MKLCDYQILEYTITELRTHGIPFVVVLRLHALDSYALNGYVLRDWRKRIGAPSNSELEDVEIFLKDLRHHCGNQDSDTSLLFDGLDRLSVGPIRAFVSGSCSIQDLDAEIQKFLDETFGSSFWRDHFDTLHDDDSIWRERGNDTC
jgi:hypothetical protein